MPEVLPFLALLLASALGPSAGQHATYRFATLRSSFESLVTYLRFEHVEPGNAYVATKFFTGCSIGKFGGQIHADGSQALVLGVWDYDGIYGSARAESPWCTRFSQGRGHVWPAGTGVRCIVETRFQAGSQYRFSLSKEGNSSGTLWSLDVSSGDSTSQVGSVFVSQIGVGRDCSLLEPEAESSMEYYTGGDFHTEASWQGPFLGGDGGLAPVDVDVDCGADAGLAAVPAEAASRGPPDLLFRRGHSMPHACERRSLWALAAGSPRPSRPPRELWIGLAALLAFFLVALAGAWMWVSQQEEQEFLAAEGDAKQVKPLLSALSFSSKASSHRSTLLSAPSYASSRASSRASSHHTVLQQEWLESQRRLNAMSAASTGLELEEPGPKPPQQEFDGVESEIHTP
mmetsp:Transcript_113810/g.332470  ORF Transcript_113810/g.332470 Transcript_113810/m.332470 type:complete len:401 (-) Transcript_113810:234-1436(-)